MTDIARIVPSYIARSGGQRFIGSGTTANIMFVSILKNAHSWAYHLLKTNFDFHPASFSETVRLHRMHDARYLIIVRDPVERWVSGFAEYFCKYDLSFQKLLSSHVFQELIFDTLRFDDHTNLQMDSLIKLDTSRCVFFKLEDNLEINFMHYLSNLATGKSITPVTDPVIRHSHLLNSYKVRTIHKLKSLLSENESFMNKLLEYTKPDRELVEYLNKNNVWYTANP